MLKKFGHSRVPTATAHPSQPSSSLSSSAPSSSRSRSLVVSSIRIPKVRNGLECGCCASTTNAAHVEYQDLLSVECEYRSTGRTSSRKSAIQRSICFSPSLALIPATGENRCANGTMCNYFPRTANGPNATHPTLVKQPFHRVFRSASPIRIKTLSMTAECAVVFHGSSPSATLQTVRHKSGVGKKSPGAASSSLSSSRDVDDILAELDALDVRTNAPMQVKQSRDEARESSTMELSQSPRGAAESDTPVPHPPQERLGDPKAGASTFHSTPAPHSSDMEVPVAAAAAAHLRNLHRSLASAADAAHELSGPAGEDGAKAVEQIERRRLKYSVSDSEFDVGMSEKLFPELRRLPALHELHYGDSTSNEIDSYTYFAHKSIDAHALMFPNADIELFEMDDGTEQQQQRKAAADPSRSSLALDDDAFAEFESAGGDPFGNEADGAADKAHPEQDTETKSEATSGSTASSSVAAVRAEETPAARAEDDKSINNHNHELVPVGTAAPWFVPSSGFTHLQQLPSEDVRRLLQFLMTLRSQSKTDLPAWLQAKMEGGAQSSSKHPRSSSEKHSRDSRPAVTLEDVVRYLDSAPSPVVGFTESLDAPGFSSPAFLFTLYTENVSTQNVIGHIAALFGVPQKNFMTSTVNSKMSCAGMLCAVQPNTLRREHLLLLNVLRHPGFVIRTSGIVEVTEPQRAAQLFTEVALWKPLHCVTLLLRRVASSDRAELEHRLRAIRDVGAVFFCANREASLIRAATDTLHGFYRSAVINALQRRRAPVRLQQFLSRPNVVTATRARKTSTDSTIRQVLKSYILERGNWEKTVERTPYVWRRRWINALRSYVWNVMASRRLRHGGRMVIPGDLVVRKEFLEDSRNRAVDNVKAEHLRVVVDDTDAAEYTLEDVYIPFLRGVFPKELFAPEETNHPIMTEANMTRILKELHAPQLLYGMTEKSKFLLDVRSNAPMLFRRFIMRPLELQYTVLEDKPPVRSVHFDASRILDTDRYRLQRGERTVEEHTITSSSSFSSGSPNGSIPDSQLLDREYIVQHTTFGAAVGALSTPGADAFAVPSRDDYVVLGHVRRNLEGELVQAAPQASTSSLEAVDRLFSVELRVVARHGVSGVAQLLREHFILSGVEREEDSQLQHKVHRIRREVDVETPYLCANHYCSVCYNRCHDSKEACAEFQYKKNKHDSQKMREKALKEEADAEATMQASTPASNFQLSNGTLTGTAVTTSVQLPSQTPSFPSGGGSDVQLLLRLELRRRSHEQLWGVKLTKSLALAGLEDVSLVSHASCTVDSSSEGSHMNPSEASAVLRALLSRSGAGENKSELGNTSDMTDAPHARLAALSQWISQCEPQDDRASTPVPGNRSSTSDVMVCPPHLFRASSTTEAEGLYPIPPKQVFRLCAWRLTRVEESPVHARAEVAATFVKFAKEKSVRLTFCATLSQQEVEELLATSQFSGGNTEQQLLFDATHTVDVTQFPEHVDVTFSRQLQRKSSTGSGSWGIRLGQRSSDGGLTIANLHNFMGFDDSKLNESVKAVAFPLLSAESIASIPLVYNVQAVNGTPVHTQEDVVRVLRSSRLTSSLVLTLTRVDMLSSEGKAIKAKDTQSSASRVADISAHDDVLTERKDDVHDVVLTRSNCSSLQCKLMTPKQRQHAVVTIAVNRRANAPQRKWGIRLQRNTLRLKGIQNNRFFTFQVFAPKQQHAVRISDSLRVVERDGDDDDQERNQWHTHGLPATVFSDYAYVIAGVNNTAVHSPDQLRECLAAESQESDADSVTLQVRQYRLLNLAIQFERDSVSQPLGISVHPNMVIQNITPESPIARAILEATNPSCSLRNLIRRQDSRAAAAADSQTSPAEGAQEGADSGASVVVDTASTGKDPTFDFSLDEDAAAVNVTDDDASLGRSGSASNDNVREKRVDTLDVIQPTTTESSRSATQGAAVGPTLEDLNMVDGFALPFARAQQAFAQNQQQRLQANPDVQIVWRLTYSVQFGTLRTTKDVEMAMRGSTSDTWFIQQCIQDQD